ncbi:MAG TPA: FlgD immunoglobulin-like domain containing protein, partial [Candidatus Ozemobacteraceae bacterium]|nr:FlgD immunoglobulin-like domain containing protein [Candidatus Ozemobacteraceae bacterium]
ITGTGRLAIMADVKAPTLLNISHNDRQELDDPNPVFEGALTDYGCGLKPDTFKFLIDGVAQTGATLKADGTFRYEVRKTLVKGKHQIEFSVEDLAGNVLAQTFEVVAPGAFAIGQIISYPNPVQGNNVWFSYNLEQAADDIKLKIYDAAGDKVAEFDTFDFAVLKTGRVRWDLTNENGRRISNGVYFYKFEATKAGRTLKARGKLAVMR